MYFFQASEKHKKRTLSPEKPPASHHSKAKKIKVKVELERERTKRPHGSKDIGKAPKKQRPEKNNSPDKKTKMKTADLAVKVLVPHFKNGLIASKEVFKFVAREMTHVILKRDSNRAQSAEFHKRFFAAFFKSSGIIFSEEDAKKKITEFESSSAAKTLM